MSSKTVSYLLMTRWKRLMTHRPADCPCKSTVLKMYSTVCFVCCVFQAKLLCCAMEKMMHSQARLVDMHVRAAVLRCVYIYM